MSNTLVKIPSKSAKSIECTKACPQNRDRGRKPFILALAINSITVCISPGVVLAQTAPTKAELLSLVAAQLPTYWKAEDLTVQSPSKSESGGAERLIYKFSLTASPRVPLYAGVRRAGPFEVVIKTLGNTDTKTLTGVIDMTSAAKAWNSGVSLDQTLDKFGQPTESFDRPTLISGDPATKTKLDQLNSETVLKAVEVLKKEMDAKLAEERAKGEAQIQAQRQSDEEALLKLISEQAAERGKLIAKQSEKISELKQGLSTERANLVRELGSASDILKLQAKLRSTLAQIGINDQAAMSSFTEIHQKRLSVLGKLPKTWDGSATCHPQGSSQMTTVNGVNVKFDKVLGAGFTATFSISGRGLSMTGINGTVHLHNDTVSFPMTLDFRIPGITGYRGDIVDDSFQVQLSKTGEMSGTFVRSYEYGSSKIWDCKINLSS